MVQLADIASTRAQQRLLQGKLNRYKLKPLRIANSKQEDTMSEQHCIGHGNTTKIYNLPTIVTLLLS